ncbi:hypothetical protein K466DRAFT_668149 [Polyporus arcularius HHB13444]|uniref:Uncharacterized protein n=1 Tax=Polyporus arcularius HHB13444 TaxID=1314778 RepID=A0A5C3NPW1_9APHY|nr:hypothetical protein K466DRAFT_668149 [Polyporus arcularius HHB13444]
MSLISQRAVTNTLQEVSFRRLPDGKLHATIISFGKAGINHNCRFKGEIVPDVRGPEPAEDRVPCPELWEVVYLSEIYTPATVEYFGEAVPVEWAKDPETLLQMGGRPKGCSEVQARAHAETVCAEYKDWLELRAECDEESFEL